jgi:hypothetical protein
VQDGSKQKNVKPNDIFVFQSRDNLGLSVKYMAMNNFLVFSPNCILKTTQLKNKSVVIVF